MRLLYQAALIFCVLASIWHSSCTRCNSCCWYGRRCYAFEKTWKDRHSNVSSLLACHRLAKATTLWYNYHIPDLCLRQALLLIIRIGSECLFKAKAQSRISRLSLFYRSNPNPLQVLYTYKWLSVKLHAISWSYVWKKADKESRHSEYPDPQFQGWKPNCIAVQSLKFLCIN